MVDHMEVDIEDNVERTAGVVDMDMPVAVAGIEDNVELEQVVVAVEVEEIELEQVVVEVEVEEIELEPELVVELEQVVVEVEEADKLAAVDRLVAVLAVTVVESASAGNSSLSYGVWSK